MGQTLFPMFVRLAGRRCLVAGAGKVAEPKIVSLIESGAEVVVVAPEATPRVQAWAREACIEWVQRVFTPADLERAFLVIAATNDADVNRVIFELARERGVLCNAVDDRSHCDFFYPAVVRRGQLQLAVSTGGRSPALAARLRKELERQFGPEYGAWVENIGDERHKALASDLSAGQRRQLLIDVASRAAFDRHCMNTERRRTRIKTAGKHAVGEGKVYLVGAGPGALDLLTLRAIQLLQQADAVLHDDLVSPEIVRLASAGARVENVGKRCGRKGITQEEINEAMIAHVRAGRQVVRLKGGDPSLFGRLGEEADALREAGVAFEIVPGITAASAAAAAGAISLTDRRHSSAVTFVSGHSSDGNRRPAWRAIAETGSAIVIYMPGRDLSDVAADLMQAGIPADMPCLLVSRAGLADQRLVSSTVGRLSETTPLAAPSILIVGEIARTHRSGRYHVGLIAPPMVAHEILAAQAVETD